jgi:hypothetical protein
MCILLIGSKPRKQRKGRNPLVREYGPVLLSTVMPSLACQTYLRAHGGTLSYPVEDLEHGDADT